MSNTCSHGSGCVDPGLQPPHHVHVATEGVVRWHKTSDELHEHNAHAVDVALLGHLQGVCTLCTKRNNRMVISTYCHCLKIKIVLMVVDFRG
jgi:hypothetical protein